MIGYYWSLLDAAEEKDWVEEIYHRYRGLIKYMAFLKLKNEQLAEDAVHDVMLALIRAAEKLQHCTEEELKGFLYLVTRNVAVDLWRKERRHEALDPEDLSLPAATESDPQQRLGEQAVRMCIDAMPPRYRDVLELSAYYGFTSKEIAALLQLSPAAVRKRLERARALLKGVMEHDGI